MRAANLVGKVGPYQTSEEMPEGLYLGYGRHFFICRPCRDNSILAIVGAKNFSPLQDFHGRIPIAPGC